MDYGNGGRGKKAPYDTTHVRIPLPIKPAVWALAKQFRHDLSLEAARSLTTLDDDDGDDDDDVRETDPTDLETIQAQAEMIRAYASEISYLKYKLHQRESLTTLAEALRQAKQIFTQKKSASVSLVKLLTAIYSVDLTVAHLKEDELMPRSPDSPSFIQNFREGVGKES